MSRGVGFLEQYQWNQIIGGEAAEESGTVIAYRVSTSIWHVSWGNPEVNDGTTGGYQIFNSILGWNNTATYGTILSYIFYWLAVIGFLIYLYFDEKKSAIRKAKAGEWEVGDIVLENAKNYIDETGEIIVGQKQHDIEKHDNKNNEVRRGSDYHVEQVVIDSNVKHT